MGSNPTYDPAVFTRPLTQSQVDDLYPRPGALAADQPGDRRGLPDRLDLQADHLDRGAGERRGDADRADLRRRRLHARRHHLPERRRRRLRDAQPAGRAAGLLGRLLLHARRPHVSGHGAAEVGGPARDRQGDGHRPAGRAAAACCRRPPGATSCTGRTSPTGPGRRATTSTSRSGRATCRPTRCRWRSPTRRSPTAAWCRARTSACRSRTRPGASCARSSPSRPPGADRPGVARHDPRRPA